MKLHLFLLSVVIILLSYVAVSACDITINIESPKNTKFKNNDELVVKTTVVLTHRNCHLSLESTKFEPKNVDILQATKWTETSKNVWERKLKLKINIKDKTNPSITATRVCKKDGGTATLSIPLGK